MKNIDLKETAVLIRQTLRAAFPKTTFSVRTKRYSGGCSIDVGWVDGPAAHQQVTPILQRFEGKGFDGMVDLSYYCGQRMFRGERVDFCGAYVRGSRHVSKELMTRVADRVCYETGAPMPEINEHGWIQGGHDIRVPFQWHAHWIEGDQKTLDAADLEKPGYLLASDPTQGEWLSTLIDRIAAAVSLEKQQPAELPEYIPEKQVA